MRIDRKKSSRKTLIVTLAIIVLLVIVGCIVYAYKKNTTEQDKRADTASKRSPDGINYSKPTTDQQAAGATQKAQAQQSVTPSTGQQIGVTITALNQTSSQVQLRTLINIVSDTGTCTVTLTKAGTTVTKQSSIQAGPSSSTCQGFDIPTNELSAGEWRVTVSVVDGTRSGSMSRTLTVQ